MEQSFVNLIDWCSPVSAIAGFGLILSYRGLWLDCPGQAQVAAWFHRKSAR